MAINRTPITSPTYKGGISSFLKPRTEGAPEIALSISNKTLYISHDLGVTWFKAENVRDPDGCFGEFEGYIGVKNKAHDTFYTSFDDGITFNRFPLPKNIDVSWGVSCSVCFSQPKSLIIKGYNPTLKQRLTCDTNDLGKTWHVSMSWDKCRFTKPIFLDPRNADMTISMCGYEYRDVWYRHKYNTDELFVSFDGINVKKFEFPPDLWPKGVTYSVREFANGFFESLGSILFYLCPRSTEEPAAYANPCGKLVVLDKNSNQLKVVLDNVPFDDECIFRCIDLDNGTFVANIVPDIELTKYLEAKRSSSNYEITKYQTVISHDCGEHWSPLIGPNGADLNLVLRKHYECDGCYDAPIPAYGTCIAYGNEGTPLRIDNFDELLPPNDSMKTYITNDSGYTWSELSTKPILYVIGNRGKIIFEEPPYEVDALVYSIDSGVTWHRYELGFWAYISIGNGYTYTSNNFQISIRRGKETYCFTLTFVDEDTTEQTVEL